MLARIWTMPDGVLPRNDWPHAMNSCDPLELGIESGALVGSAIRTICGRVQVDPASHTRQLIDPDIVQHRTFTARLQAESLPSANCIGPLERFAAIHVADVGDACVRLSDIV